MSSFPTFYRWKSWSFKRVSKWLHNYMVSHLNQGLNPGLLWVLRCRQDSLPPAPPGKPQYNMLLLLLFSHTVVSNSLQPHRLQHSRPPCPSSSPRVCLSSCSFYQWFCPAISSSDTLFSFCPQSLQHQGLFQRVICGFFATSAPWEASVRF